MSKKIKKGDKIAVHYTGTLEDGSVFDTSRQEGRTPLEFTAGAGQMIPGFDAAVIDMQEGESKKITLVPDEAYGERDDKKMQEFRKKDLVSFTAAGFLLEKGEKLPTQFGTFPIVKADEESVVVDMNHELAGKTLVFDIEIVSIKKK